MVINTKEFEVQEYEKSEMDNFTYTNNGHFFSNTGTLVYVYLYQNKIDFCDLDFKIKKTISEPDDEIIIDPINIENSKYHYLNVCFVDSNRFYLLYQGYTHRDYVERKNNYSIEVYDLAGTPITRYLLDRQIQSFTVDRKNNKIYACSEDNLDVVLVYDLDE